MLYSEQMHQICEKLGVKREDCKDGLYSTLLQAICDACDGGGSGGGGSATKGVLTVSSDVSIPLLESVVDAGMSLLVDGTPRWQAVGMIEGTPIAFCVWRGGNSRNMYLTNAWGLEDYDLPAGEYSVTISYPQI